MSDLKQIMENPPEVCLRCRVDFHYLQGVSASPLTDDNLLVWGATILGPDDSVWEGAHSLVAFIYMW